jgi:hypothetical protein
MWQLQQRQQLFSIIRRYFVFSRHTIHLCSWYRYSKHKQYDTNKLINKIVHTFTPAASTTAAAAATASFAACSAIAFPWSINTVVDGIQAEVGALSAFCSA